MWTSFTKKPVKPMIKKPTEVAPATLINSVNKNKSQHDLEILGDTLTFAIGLVTLQNKVITVLSETLQRVHDHLCDCRHLVVFFD